MYRNFSNFPLLTGILLSAIFLGCLASCAVDRKTYRLYQGPQLPDDETAQIICTGERIRINSVNSQKSPEGKDTFGNVRLEILPGDYLLTVSFSGTSLAMAYGEDGRYRYNIYYRHDSLNNVDITMRAKASHIYRVNSTHNYDQSRWYVIVKDETGDRRILKEGPYPLNRVKTGDSRQARIIYQD